MQNSINYNKKTSILEATTTAIHTLLTTAYNLKHPAYWLHAPIKEKESESCSVVIAFIGSKEETDILLDAVFKIQQQRNQT